MSLDQVQTITVPTESYLLPYRQAAARYGGGFGSLLWASQKSQRVRFDAIRRLCPLAGKSLLDAGCGRADFLGFLLDRGVRPADYLGLEAVEALAAAAEAKNYPNCRIVRSDFVRDPRRLFVGADVVVFSGSLNTLGPGAFQETVRRAWDAAAEAVVFNFLSSPRLAGKDFLVWHRPENVQAYAQSLSSDVQVLSDYLTGDCTVAMIKLPRQ